jgi:hypothetical protein
LGVTQSSDADWLEEAARYFEKRPTGGEDMAFWANTANAERCRSIATALRAASGVEVKGLDDDQIMEIIKEVAPWRTEAKLYDLLTYEKSPPMIPQATYDVPSMRARSFVRAVEARIRPLNASPLPTVEVTEEMVERLIELATDVGRHSSKTVPMGANPPLFDGMQDDTDGAWLNRVGVAKRIRSFFTAALSQNKGEE